MTEVLLRHAEIIFFFGAIALVTNWIAYSRGFYTFPLSKRGEKNLPNFVQVAAVFAIYLGTTLLLVPLLARLFFFLYSSASALPVNFMGYMQLISMMLSGVFLYVFCLSQRKEMIHKIWKDTSKPGSKPILFDFFLGIATWAVAFPLVAAIGQISDLVVELLFGIQNYEQVAVRYLKMALASPSLLATALFIILIAAPFIEELLFRGFLQNWLKSLLGAKSAILIASLCFAFFHLSASQGLGNISLGISLFSFSCFLGFIYERQSSLLASIGLHMTFNVVSCFRILMLPES